MIKGSLSGTYTRIQGGNRLHVDMSAKWIDEEELGQDDSPVEPAKEKSRYNHSANIIRAYWW